MTRFDLARMLLVGGIALTSLLATGCGGLPQNEGLSAVSNQSSGQFPSIAPPSQSPRYSYTSNSATLQAVNDTSAERGPARSYYDPPAYTSSRSSGRFCRRGFG